jgi:hypothetical protein
MNFSAFGRVALFIITFGLSPALAADEVSEGALVSPSASDILEQIGGADALAEKPDDALILMFPSGGSDLSAFHKQEIEVLIVPHAAAGRVKVEAFAKSSRDQSRTPRRVSLERALRVREFLQEQGVSPQRVDIFPMGDQMPAPVTDSVKIHISK